MPPQTPTRSLTALRATPPTGTKKEIALDPAESSTISTTHLESYGTDGTALGVRPVGADRRRLKLLLVELVELVTLMALVTLLLLVLRAGRLGR